MTEPRRDLLSYSVQQDESKPALDYDKQRNKEVADEAALKAKLKKARDGE